MKHRHGYNCCCEPPCEELLVKGHLVYQKSIARFVESDNIISNDFKQLICDAIAIIDKREELQAIATQEENEALEILGLYEKKCANENNIERCKPLFDKALSIFKVESAKVQEIKEELFKILKLLEEYQAIREDGDFVFFERWIPCLHDKDGCD